MKKRYIILSMVVGAFFLISLLNILITIKLKKFAYQDIRKEYDWGEIAIMLVGTEREENSNLTIIRNPYKIEFLIWNNSSDKCLAKLNYFLLRNNNDNIFYVSSKTSFFEYSPTNSQVVFFNLQNIFLKEYKSYDVSFQADVVCNGKVTNSIEEKNLIFYTKYLEKNYTWFDQILSI